MLWRVRVRGGSGSGLHGSILSLAPLGCLCANFAANQSRANRRFRAHRLAHQLDAHRFKGTVLLLQRVLQPLLRALQQSVLSLATIRQLPVFVDTGMDTRILDTAPQSKNPAQWPGWCCRVLSRAVALRHLAGGNWAALCNRGFHVVSHQKSKAPSSKSGCRGVRACHASSRGRWRWWVDGLACAPCMATRLRVTW